MHTILLATDGSPTAVKATNTAIELAQASHWRLRVLSVWQIPVFPYDYPALRDVADFAEVERLRARSAAQHAVEEAEALGIQATAEIREGDAVEEICAAAEETAADLVVVGAHGWGPLKRLVFGSVSSAVLYHAPCPVLVVRGTEAAAGEEGAARQPAAAGHL